MILRPSKVFVSFHQLRHYFQTKVSELLVTAQHQQHPPPSTVVTQFRNYSTTQQSILFFSDLQRALIQITHPPIKTNAVHNNVLLNVMQRHFSVLKVFSQQPTVQGHTWMMAKQSQHIRNLVSCHHPIGLPRSAMLGLGRMNGLGTPRSFSTGSPGITIFQNTTQPNLMAHLSTRIFSPAISTKLPPQQPQKTQSSSAVEKKPTFVPFFSSEKDESSEEGSVFSHDEFQHAPIYTTQKEHHMKSFMDLQQAQEEVQEASYVVSELMTYEDDQKTYTQALGSIVQHDAMMVVKEEGRTLPNKRKLNVGTGGTERHSSITGHDYKKRPSPFLEREVSHIYLMIDLKSILFSPDWTTQSLNASFIKTMEASFKGYQMRILYVLNLLDRLQFSQDPFRVLVRRSELRIYFPCSLSIKTKLDAIECLKRLQVIDQDEDCYQIMVEKSSVDLHSSSFKEVGLDYFHELHMFLDRTDDLIESHSPSFLSSSR